MNWGRRGRGRMVVGIYTTDVVNSNLEVYNYVIKFVSDLRQVGCFLRVHHDITEIFFESGVKHHQTNKQNNGICTL